MAETRTATLPKSRNRWLGRWLVGDVGHRSTLDARVFGVPAHITVLYPWLPWSAIDSAVVGELSALVAGQGAFQLEFAATGRFPGVLYLAPDPAAPCRALTRAVHDRWPEVAPYEGRFLDVVPHLTVAVAPDDVLDDVERAVLPGLPVVTSVSEVTLLTVADGWWRTMAAFALEV